jgi:hypothetical protein
LRKAQQGSDYASRLRHLLRTLQPVENRNSGTGENIEVPGFDQTALVLGAVKALEDDLNAKVDANRQDLEKLKSDAVEGDRSLEQRLQTAIQALRAEVNALLPSFGCDYSVNTIQVYFYQTWF